MTNPSGDNLQLSCRYDRRLTLRRFPIVSLIGCLVIVALAMNPAFAMRWQFDRRLIHSGEFWRLAACHWAHWSASHAAWSAGAFAVLGGLCEAFSRRLMILVIAASAILISVVILFFLPAITVYRGVSGIDSALFGMLAILLFREVGSTKMRRVLIVMMIVLFAAKLTWECVARTPLFMAPEKGILPLPEVHAVGFAVGVVIAIVSRPIARLIV